MEMISRYIHVRRLLIFLLVFSLCGLLTWFYFYSTPVHVTLMDGKILVNPSVVWGPRTVRFYVENKGSQPHQFIAIMTEKPLGRLPVKDGQAEFYNEPYKNTTILYDGIGDSGYAMYGPTQENPPAGPPLQPGEKLEFQIGYPGLAQGGPAREETITILCNLPGHYERGEFATLTRKK